jgi:hypothetical protein
MNEKELIKACVDAIILQKIDANSIRFYELCKEAYCFKNPKEPSNIINEENLNIVCTKALDYVEGFLSTGYFLNAVQKSVLKSKLISRVRNGSALSPFKFIYRSTNYTSYDKPSLMSDIDYLIRIFDNEVF